MAVDPRTPVIAGVGQLTLRTDNPADALEPAAMMAEAALAAERDTSARGSLLQAADTIAAVSILSWRYPDPAAELARRIRATPARTVLSTVGGNSPQLLVNELAARIATGGVRVALIAGAETMYSRQRARREPRVHLEWTQPDDPPCADVIGDSRAGTNDYEMAHAAAIPTQVYPLFETALRSDAGRTVDEHQQHASALWSHFAAVSAANPYAWTTTAFTPDEIRTVSPDNRVVGFPYTKRMCANLDVDQAAALLLCSYQAARDAGVPEERIVFLHAGADAHDHFLISERWSLGESTAIGAIGRDLLGAAGVGVGIDDIARFDLYSCFPSAVQMAMAALGLAGPGASDSRPLTVTGGLAFAGGPGNNYVTHSIASMVDACREDRGSYGYVTALGWYVTKHSAGVYSTTPPDRGYLRVDPKRTQATVDGLPRREAAGPVDGHAMIEATCVMHDRDGTPVVAIVAALDADGRRVLANSREPAVLKSMCQEAWERRVVAIRTDGTTNTLDV
jgi:acetyl-CoA C-acetyltransferase